MLTLFALAVSVTATPAAGNRDFSVIIVDAKKVIYRDDVAITENGEEIFYWDGVYEARNLRVRTLSGPTVNDSDSIIFAGSHLTSRSDGVTARKMFMVVRRGEHGWWGYNNWNDVKSRLCLEPSKIAELNLDMAFVRAKANAKGERCIRV